MHEVPAILKRKATISLTAMLIIYIDGERQSTFLLAILNELT